MRGTVNWKSVSNKVRLVLILQWHRHFAWNMKVFIEYNRWFFFIHIVNTNACMYRILNSYLSHGLIMFTIKKKEKKLRLRWLSGMNLQPTMFVVNVNEITVRLVWRINIVTYNTNCSHKIINVNNRFEVIEFKSRY